MCISNTPLSSAGPALNDHARRAVEDPRGFITALHGGYNGASPGSSMHGGASGKSVLSHVLSHTTSHSTSPPDLSPQSDPPSLSGSRDRLFRRSTSVASSYAESVPAPTNSYVASHAHISATPAAELQELPHFTQPSSVRSERRGGALSHFDGKAEALRHEGYASRRDWGSGSHIRSRAAAAGAGGAAGSMVGSRGDDFAAVARRNNEREGGSGSGSHRGVVGFLRRASSAQASPSPCAGLRADTCADATLAEAGTGNARSCANETAAGARFTERKGYGGGICADDLAEAAAVAAADPRALAPWSSVFLVTVVAMVVVLLLPALLPRVGPPPDELLLLPVLVMIVVLMLACRPTITRSANPGRAVVF
ncbi:hypothetical protein CLOM_g18650 [Closterium sp. NIES-68]|nr:hypothetical protein CLOM_g18650 [Closterium sp. NIES-68]GJP81715.1 hypothetical protein CLOP_g11852 [Closterium sp. NIES-67]